MAQIIDISALEQTNTLNDYDLFVTNNAERIIEYDIKKNILNNIIALITLDDNYTPLFVKSDIDIIKKNIKQISNEIDSLQVQFDEYSFIHDNVNPLYLNDKILSLSGMLDNYINIYEMQLSDINTYVSNLNIYISALDSIAITTEKNISSYQSNLLSIQKIYSSVDISSVQETYTILNEEIQQLSNQSILVQDNIFNLIIDDTISNTINTLSTFIENTNNISCILNAANNNLNTTLCEVFKNDTY